jgi:hypothetical protein
VGIIVSRRNARTTD